MRCRLHQDRQGTRRAEVTARPATQPDPARPGHSSAPMNLHPHRELRSRRTNRPRPPHLRQPGFFIPALSFPPLSHAPVFPSHSALFHNGSIFHVSLPLRHGLSHYPPTTDPLRHILLSPPFHNGSISRDSLPLRHGLSHCPPTTDPLRHILLSPPFHNGTIFRISLPLRHDLSRDPLLQAFWTALPSCSSSTTAAFPAFRCRCGMTFLAAPLIQTPWATFYFRPLSTTAAFPAFRCRCGMAFLTDPLLQTPCATFSFRHCRPSGPHCHPVPLPQRHYFQRFSAVAAARSGRCRRKWLFTVTFQNQPNQPELSACP